MSLAGFILLSSLGGCDRNAKELVPHPSDEYPGVIEIGRLEVTSLDQIAQINTANGQIGGPGHITPETCDVQEDGRQHCFYGELGQAETGKKGGATFTFIGTGDEVCLIVDPETVFWAQSIAPAAINDQFAYPDYYNDDGDLDLFAGLSSYYTGSPGVEIGDFTGFYTDSLGNTVEIEYGECFQTGAQTGMDTAHAGRGTVEYCNVDTDLKEGIEYTVVLDNFSVPLDDGVLSFGVAVIGERCARVTHDECMIRHESRYAFGPDAGRTVACTDVLELAACDGQLGTFCCANPEMCGDETKIKKDDLCGSIYSLGGQKVQRDEWCASTGLCCEYGGFGSGEIPGGGDTGA